MVRSLGFSLLALVAVAAAPLQDSKTDDEEIKKKALQWIDDYRAVQVLFHDDDLKRLREEVAAGEPAKAKEWWEETQDIRQALGSDRWRETRRWLKDFLKVQAIYSDEEIDAFREEAKAAAKESPEKFVELLKEIATKRSRLATGAATDAKLREQKLEIARAYRKEDAKRRAEAQKIAAKAAASSQNNTVKPVPKRQYRRPPPLVDSLDAARWTVMSEFWGPYRRR